MSGMSPGADVTHARRWFVVVALSTVLAAVGTFLADPGPPVAVYSTTDFNRLPMQPADTSAPVEQSCVAIRNAGGAMELISEECGSSMSTFRVIGRAGTASQCVRDADMVFWWYSGAVSGAVCLDYDWTAGQCMTITADSAMKGDCTDDSAVRPSNAIIGALDVSYCPEGGIAHPTRHFTVCTTPGRLPEQRSQHGT